MKAYAAFTDGVCNTYSTPIGNWRNSVTAF